MVETTKTDDDTAAKQSSCAELRCPRGPADGEPAKKIAPAWPTKPSSRLKWFVLAFLVVQNSSASLTMRYARSQAAVAPWNSQTAVLLQELLKALVCTVILVCEGTFASSFAHRAEVIKTGVPAILYLCQNNLQYIAVTYLDASTYAVMYQLKILTTGLLSVMLLGTRLSAAKCLSLLILTTGVSIVVVSQIKDSSATRSTEDFVRGSVAVLLSCVSSGLAGVSFEKLLKGSTVSLWARNLHLAMYSGVIGIIGIQVGDPGFSFRDHFLQGYTSAVWLSIFNNAFGGLLIAVVIKYADNILKNFSTSLSIILTATISVLVFGTPINAHFLGGTGLVIYAVFLYSGMGSARSVMSCINTAKAKTVLLHVLGAATLVDTEIAPGHAVVGSRRRCLAR